MFPAGLPYILAAISFRSSPLSRPYICRYQYVHSSNQLLLKQGASAHLSENMVAQL